MLVAGGSMALGGAILAVDAVPGSHGRVMQTAILTAAGGLTGLPIVQNSTPALKGTVVSDGRTLFLILLNTDASIAAVSTTPNGAAVGGAIDRLRSSSTGDLAT